MSDHPLAVCADYPLNGRVSRWLDRPHAAVGPTGLTRESYLRVAEGITRCFARQQCEDGRILDPYERAEKQYATPAFACAAAILAGQGNTELLEPASRAMTAAIDQLVAGNAADRHADFFTVLIMHAYEALRRLTGEDSLSNWDRQISQLNPLSSYRDLRPQPYNWNIVALAGEYLRYKAGLGRSTADGFIAEYLPRHLPNFTQFGMYRDPNEPMAYDAFARVWLMDMLHHGYDMVEAHAIRDHVERGAWTSLFMQSPSGEFPAGGRSGGHQWNEAQLALMFEMMAVIEHRRGQWIAASAFKRAARLALGSILPWVRPEGDLWIVKNRFDPELRFGYETYSFHSQYNLLTAALLAIAFQRADESIPEGPTPAETGGFAFALEGPFHKLFANCAGMYVEMELDANPHFQSTGVIRVHSLRQNKSWSLQDSVTRGALYGTAGQAASQNLALGPEWQINKVWQRLADSHGAPYEVSILEERADCVRLSVMWRQLVTETITVLPDRIVIEDVVRQASAMAALIPFPICAENGDFNGAVVPLTAGSSRERLNIKEPTRYGFVDAIRCVAEGDRLQYEIRP